MSKSFSSSLLRPVVSDPSADRLYDDCALDHTLGVLRRSLPRTYAGRFASSQPSTSPAVFRFGRSTIAWMKRMISSDPLQMSTDVGRLARHAALASGFVGAVVAIFVSIMQQSGATAHAASGIISFATVSTVTLLLALPALHLLVWLGVDVSEFVASDRDC